MPAIDPRFMLDAVRNLSALGKPTTAEDVGAFLNRDHDHVDIESVRGVLESLADSGDLGRIQSAAHHRAQPLEWTSSYLPTNAD